MNLDVWGSSFSIVVQYKHQIWSLNRSSAWTWMYQVPGHHNVIFCSSDHSSVWIFIMGSYTHLFHIIPFHAKSMHGTSVFGHFKFWGPQLYGVTLLSFNFAWENLIFDCYCIIWVWGILFLQLLWNHNFLAESWSRSPTRPETTSLVWAWMYQIPAYHQRCFPFLF